LRFVRQFHNVSGKIALYLLCRLTRIIPFLIAMAVTAPSLSMAASGPVSFSGQVPCRLAAQECRVETRKHYVFAETAGIEYQISNEGRDVRTIRPVVRSGTALSVYPSAQEIAPGEMARFIVLVGMEGKAQQKIEVCAKDGSGRISACQRYSAIAVR